MATPPDFVAGNVLTAAQMNGIGLWLIKTQTVGTGVASVTVNDAFSADYENYRIMWIGGTASTAGNIHLTLGATTTGYYYGLNFASYAGVGGAAGGANAGFIPVGGGQTTRSFADADIYGPFATIQTSVAGRLINLTTTSGASGESSGFLNNTTSYTAFTLTPNAGTISGGIIYVYGYRD